MRRHLMMFALVGLFGASLLSSEAAACHKKKAACEPVACAAPCPPPAPVCEPCAAPKKKCGLFGMFKKKKAACEPVACATPCAAPVAYAAPYYAPVQPSAQYGSGQSY